MWNEIHNYQDCLPLKARLTSTFSIVIDCQLSIRVLTIEHLERALIGIGLTIWTAHWRVITRAHKTTVSTIRLLERVNVDAVEWVLCVSPLVAWLTVNGDCLAKTFTLTTNARGSVLHSVDEVSDSFERVVATFRAVVWRSLHPLEGAGTSSAGCVVWYQLVACENEQIMSLLHLILLKKL